MRKTRINIMPKDSPSTTPLCEITQETFTCKVDDSIPAPSAQGELGSAATYSAHGEKSYSSLPRDHFTNTSNKWFGYLGEKEKTVQCVLVNKNTRRVVAIPLGKDEDFSTYKVVVSDDYVLTACRMHGGETRIKRHFVTMNENKVSVPTLGKVGILVGSKQNSQEYIIKSEPADIQNLSISKDQKYALVVLVREDPEAADRADAYLLDLSKSTIICKHKFPQVLDAHFIGVHDVITCERERDAAPLIFCTYNEKLNLCSEKQIRIAYFSSCAREFSISPSGRFVHTGFVITDLSNGSEIKLPSLISDKDHWHPDADLLVTYYNWCIRNPLDNTEHRPENMSCGLGNQYVCQYSGTGLVSPELTGDTLTILTEKIIVPMTLEQQKKLGEELDAIGLTVPAGTIAAYYAPRGFFTSTPSTVYQQLDEQFKKCDEELEKLDPTRALNKKIEEVQILLKTNLEEAPKADPEKSAKDRKNYEESIAKLKTELPVAETTTKGNAKEIQITNQHKQFLQELKNQIGTREKQHPDKADTFASCVKAAYEKANVSKEKLSENIQKLVDELEKMDNTPSHRPHLS
jgi:hypothetical protein